MIGRNLVILAIALFSVIGHSEEVRFYNNYPSLGFGFDLRQYGSGSTFELQFPVLYSFKRQEITHALTSYLILSTFGVNNTVKDDDGNFIKASNAEISFGVRVISPLIENSVSSSSLS